MLLLNEENTWVTTEGKLQLPNFVFALEYNCKIKRRLLNCLEFIYLAYPKVSQYFNVMQTSGNPMC